MVTDRLKNQPQFMAIVGGLAGFAAILVTYLIVQSTSEGDLVVSFDQSSVQIAVEVRGAVESPGLYRLPADARLGDAISAAGGAGEEADLSVINLARRLDDGEIVSIPVVSPATPMVATSDPAQPEEIQGMAYRIDVNTASQPELESLPGIGPVIAGRIIEYRTTNGPFTSAEGLLNVEGISENLLAEIQSLITIGP